MQEERIHRCKKAERGQGEEEGQKERERKTREEERVEGKGSNRKRGESCAKTKTEMGLVTAMVGAAGLALSLGPLYSHPQEAGPFWSGREWLVNRGGGEWARFSSDSGLGDCWKTEDSPCSPGQARPWGRDGSWGGSLLPRDIASQH